MIAKRIFFVVAIAAPLWLSACDDSTVNLSRKTVNAELTGYNHTDRFIGAFYVNGQWGGNIDSGSGGGSFVCCVELPNPWHEGLKVRVKWEDYDGVIHERDVPVPRYEAKKAGGLNVHFLRSGEIKVFAGMTFLGHPDYPLKGEEAKLPPSIMDKRNAAYEAEQAASATKNKENNK